MAAYRPRPDQPVTATTSPVATTSHRVLLWTIPMLDSVGTLCGNPAVSLRKSTTPLHPKNRKNADAKIAVLLWVPSKSSEGTNEGIKRKEAKRPPIILPMPPQNSPAKMQAKARPRPSERIGNSSRIPTRYDTSLSPNPDLTSVIRRLQCAVKRIVLLRLERLLNFDRPTLWQFGAAVERTSSQAGFAPLKSGGFHGALLSGFNANC